MLYYNLLTIGKLNKYLFDVDEQAEKIFSLLVEQLTEKENITEQLKAENPIELVKRMNNIRNQQPK